MRRFDTVGWERNREDCTPQLERERLRPHRSGEDCTGESMPGRRLLRRYHCRGHKRCCRAGKRPSAQAVLHSFNDLIFSLRSSQGGGSQYTYAVQTGRRDGVVSLASEAISNLPGASFSASQAIAAFGAKGLGASDMVLLLGNLLFHGCSTTSRSTVVDR